RRQAAERAEREGHLRLEPERRMAAHEDQLEPLIGKVRLFHLVLLCFRQGEQLRLLSEGAVAADARGGPGAGGGAGARAAGGGRQPGARVVRYALARPALRRDRECLLGCLLGEIEVPEVADEGRQDAAPLVAEDLVDQRASA